MKYSRLKNADRSPVQTMIDRVREYQDALKYNPEGFDQMSYNGYENVIQNLEQWRNLIDSSVVDPNPVWGILSENAKYFTTLQYKILLTLAHQVTGI